MSATLIFKCWCFQYQGLNFPPTMDFSFLWTVCTLSHIHLFVTSWIVACQVPLSVRFSRQKCWSGLSFPPSGNLPDPGSKLASLLSPALADRFFTPSATWVNNSKIHEIRLWPVISRPEKVYACKKNASLNVCWVSWLYSVLWCFDSLWRFFVLNFIHQGAYSLL